MLDLLLTYTNPCFLLSTAFTLFLLSLPSRHIPDGQSRPHVIVLVLGDIGRSPRMQYHALSIARNNGKVTLIGYNETSPRPELLSNRSIAITSLPPLPRAFDTSTAARFIVFAPLKAVFQLLSLLYILLYSVPSSAGYILLQNPPSIPTLAVARFVAVLRRQEVVIDWHNFGYSILRLKLRGHPLVWVAKIYEMLFARGSAGLKGHITVTESMRAFLRESWSVERVKVVTMHDRPPAHFQPVSQEARVAFLRAHEATRDLADRILRGDTRLVISSTSWTADEDFGRLLEALVEYDRYAGGENFLRPGSAPDLLVVVTGKGPMRDAYMATVGTMEWSCVTVKSVWLEAEDYPKMIGCADLGVCLHTSSSGLDLPMKVVDLFGVGVPVVAVRYGALQELVKHGENGVTFETAEELTAFLTRLLAKKGEGELKRLKAGAMKEGNRRWDGEWDQKVKGLFGL